jgi:hypothetical protein
MPFSWLSTATGHSLPPPPNKLAGRKFLDRVGKALFQEFGE